MRDPALAYFAFSFSQLMREGLGPGRPGAELTAIHQFESAAVCTIAAGSAHAELGAQIFDGQTLADPVPLVLSLAPDPAPVSRVRVRFLTPTELKAEGKVVREPEFGVLFARIRDRLHTLRSLYGAGPLPLDFSALGERARRVRRTSSDLRWEMAERRSGKTGQTHPLGGFMGWVEYEGELSEFLPYLRAASWTGVGRQTTWGKGHVQIG
jgi:hypothetical protein